MSICCKLDHLNQNKIFIIFVKINLKMQKGSNSSKKTSTSQPQVDQYKSESSKSSTLNVIKQQKQSYAFQNMKEFKCQIDHEIAKCLDTLDRQGLKFLKETLRASKIFGLNTQELGITQPLEENISLQQQSPPKHKEKQIPKKIQSLKHNVQIKKVSKPQLNKKVQSNQLNQVRNIKQNQPIKNDLNEKINKRLDSLNIKTGKKNEPVKKSEVNNKQKKEVNVEIAQEIQIQQLEEVSIQKQQPVKQITYLNSPPEPNINSHQISYQSIRSIKNYQEPKVEEENLPSKPFYRKIFKKNTEQAKPLKESKQYGVQINNQDELIKSIEQPSKKQQSIVVSHQTQMPSNTIQQKPVLPYQSINSSQASLQKKQQISQGDPYMSNLIAVISRLSPTKRNKLQRIIEKLQFSDKYSNTQSLVSDLSKNQTFNKPYIPPKQSFPKQNQLKDNHSKSRSKIQKVEKATSLKGSFIKKIGTSQTVENQLSLDNKNNEEKQKGQTKNDKQRNILQRYDDSNSQMIQEKKQSKMQSSIISESKNQSKNHQSNLEGSKSHLFQSSLLGQNESGQKLIKISKRKNQITNIVFKIISNKGHSSSVGLNSIQIFNPFGELIPIDESNLKQSNSKLIKLFTQNNKGQGWLTSLSNPTISIQNISQQVGGIRIINWNKSQLQVDRQTDMMEIWINEQLHWRGQIKGGSFKQNQVYATNIKVMEKHFQFPEIKQQLSKSIVKEEKSPKIITSSSFKNKINHREPQVKQNSSCWLEKDSVEKKLKEIEEQQKKEEKIKKIVTIRNTYALNQQQKSYPSPVKSEAKPQHKVFQFGLSWLNQDQKQKKDEYKYEKQSKSNLRSNHNDDILLQLSKGLDTKKRKDDGSLPIIINKKDQSLSKKEQMLTISKKRQQSLKIKQSKKQYLIQKQKEQDLQFQKILQSMQQRNKEKQTQKLQNKNTQFIKDPIENKGKIIAEKNFQDFMKDSLFTDKPAARKFENKSSRPLKIVQEKQSQDYINPKPSKNTNNNKQLDNLIDELNDVVAGQNNQETGEEFYIPELPKGKQINIIILSNWGHQNFVGLNGIELFDSDGQQIKPIGVACSLINSKQLYQKLFKQELLTSDEKIQIKFPKNKKIAISLTLSQRTQLAGIRLWNYNGHRVHNNIGVKKLHIKFDNSLIFSGEIQQSSGPSQNAHKYCEHILFTDNNNIINKISENDWLNKINRKEEEERMLFKTTLENFHRPITRNDEQAVKKQIQQILIEKQPIKLPKRLCFQYDPPILPQGFVLKFVLHNSWGDRFFIGLNGIQIFNQKGENISNKNLTQIRADPSSISKLQGYQRDKRIVTNLINGKNNTVADSNIWLAPFLSDVQRIDRGKPNIILMEYSKANKIAGINFYNYIKTPQRGVRQIQIFLDNFLLYRGYLKKYNVNEGSIHTSINFTKQQNLLESMNYLGYNEDHLEQQVALINQQKVIKANANVFQTNLTRPMTGKTLV